MNNLNLEDKLNRIGVRITGGTGARPKKTDWIDIERVLYESTLEVGNDGRLFMLLLGWVEIHGSHVVIEKLMKYQKEKFSPWLVALAIYAVNKSHFMWKPLVIKMPEKYFLGSLALARQQIKFKGEYEIFTEKNFLIAKDSIRIRERDVLSVKELISRNTQYKNRFIYGSNWRADIITAIDKGFDNPYQIAKVLGCSYPSALKISKDYKMANQNGAA